MLIVTHVPLPAQNPPPSSLAALLEQVRTEDAGDVMAVVVAAGAASVLLPELQACCVNLSCRYARAHKAHVTTRIHESAGASDHARACPKYNLRADKRGRPGQGVGNGLSGAADACHLRQVCLLSIFLHIVPGCWNRIALSCLRTVCVSDTGIARRECFHGWWLDLLYQNRNPSVRVRSSLPSPGAHAGRVLLCVRSGVVTLAGTWCRLIEKHSTTIPATATAGCRDILLRAPRRKMTMAAGRCGMPLPT